jgi:uncharacterized protein (TIGR00266 family)
MKFRLINEIVPAVEVCFEQRGEEMITQSGGMAWMTDGIDLRTDTNGGIMAGLGRMFAGESIFMNHYRALRVGAIISFAATLPGKIVPVQMKNHPQGLTCQKGAFLCSQASVHLEMTFAKKLGSGLFGGEGFILQKLTGAGTAFLEVDGGAVEKELGIGEIIKVDTGNVVAFDTGMPYEIEVVHGLKNMIFGGEGVFLTKITGPGKVILQTQNINGFAGEISKRISTSQ